MKAFEPLLLAIGALALSAVFEVTQKPAGMRGIVNDPSEYPVKMSGPACPGFVIASNTLEQTDHGALEGYFAVGQAFDGMLRPADPRFHWLKELRNKPVDIVIRVRETLKPEKLK